MFHYQQTSNNICLGRSIPHKEGIYPSTTQCAKNSPAINALFDIFGCISASSILIFVANGNLNLAHHETLIFR